MSNHTNDPWEAEMSRTFDRRVRDLHEAPLSLDQVKGKAGRIRRNRRVAVAGGVLAAAAVIVPVVGFAGGALTDNDSGPPVAPQPTAKDESGPGFSYLEGRTLHLADGTTVELPKRYEAATYLGDTVYASVNDPDTGFRSLDAIDASGSVDELGEALAGPVANEDHTVIAYVETDGDLVLRWEGGERVLGDVGENAQVVEVAGGPDCATDDCRVYLDEFDSDPLVYDAEGGTEVVVPDVVSLNGVEGGRLSVQTSYSDQGSCGGIYDVTLADYQWETCDYSLFDLSPDAQHVDASHAYLDGFGNAWAAILDAETAKEVARLDPEEAAITTTVWQDPAHLLVTVFDYAEGWSIWRLGVDGQSERVLGPGTKDDEHPTYVLVD